MMRGPIVMLAAGLLAASAAVALAQSPEPAAEPPPPPARPYRGVAVTLPEPLADPGFVALRKQMAEAAARKDRAALGRLTVAQGFFWIRETGDSADATKPGIDTLAAALGLDTADGIGWDMIASHADDPAASPAPDRKGAVCAPADPAFNEGELQDVVKATGTDVTDWAYTLSASVDVRSGPRPGTRVVETLGLQFVRVLPDDNAAAAAATAMKVVTPSGKTGYVAADSLAPLGNDQICYVKEAGGWKIGGYIGGGEAR